MKTKDNIVIGLLGPSLDSGKGPARWEKWRPSIALCQHENLLVTRLELLYQKKYAVLASNVVDDIEHISPETEVRLNLIEFDDPWDLQQVYGALHDFARNYKFNTEDEEYLVHITTGTHVAQICMFLLTESNYFPGKLIQTSPPSKRSKETQGTFEIIDLDLSKYDRIASRFQQETKEAVSFLKSGIETRNADFNRLIARIEQVAINSTDPLLLMGPTGAGKSRLARRIYELKRARHQMAGEFVEVNCATIRGDAAMSALFGHVKGSFTGAVRDRAGLLRAANQGMLFLDEIGVMGLDEQAMLLHALEEKSFTPLGGDKEVKSDFQLIAGTNCDLGVEVKAGRFREDLLARINLWTFRMPGLRERVEDIEPNLQYELEQFARRKGTRVTFNKEAREHFLKFASSHEARWQGNFRDLNGAVIRMGTLASGGRISLEVVEEEIERLRASWRHETADTNEQYVAELIGKDQFEKLDMFDRIQLAGVIRVCRESRSLSDAGRALFTASRERKSTSNDADRLKKYLGRFGITWQMLGERASLRGHDP